MKWLTKHWSRLAIASSGIDGLVGCERLNAAVRSIELSAFMPIIVASLVVNVLVAGFFGLATGFSLNSILPKLDVVFGPDTPSRR